MKYLISINELFEYSDITTDSIVLKSELNKGSIFDGASIDIEIKGITYHFSTQLRNFGEFFYIYFSFFIKEEKYRNDAYNFVVNKDMTISVLNTLPLVVEEYKKLLVENDLQHKEIKGFYYDADEPKRKNIYDYFFKKRLGNRLDEITTSSNHFILVKLKEAVLVENLFL
jgi:hypothetical protein